MSRSVYASLLGPEFDDSLFAPLGDERNGMGLSVLSALARLKVDPWQEAADLAGLPGATATERLASLIASLPNERSMYRESDTISARLVALLPRRATSNTAARQTLIGVGRVTRSLAVIYAIWMVIALSVQGIVASHQLPMQHDITPAPVFATIARVTPLSLASERKIERSLATGETR